MDGNIKDIIGNIDLVSFDDFSNKTKSNVKLTKKTDSVSRDFSWLPIVEECIPYLDNIIRNPRHFIIQEEDIVIVEKAKKISIETIRHLAQNTNYIQDVDDKGMIKPSKVLNINKEDTWDIYENRFIFTLVKELERFIEKYTDKELESPYMEINQQLEYVGESMYKDENVKINLNLESKAKQDMFVNDLDKQAMLDRIENVQNIVADFSNSAFIKSLNQVVPVKSPIRKTNVILKDANFQKALELWEFIMNSEIGDPIDRSTEVKDLSSPTLQKKFDLSYFLNYLYLNADLNSDEIAPKTLLEKILELLEMYAEESDISEQRLLSLMNSEIKSIIKKKNNREKRINSSYIKFIDNHKDYMEKVCKLL